LKTFYDVHKNCQTTILTCNFSFDLRFLGGPGKQMMPLCDGKMNGGGGNVAAIEPFNHIPDAMSKNSMLRKSEDNILSHATVDGDSQSYGGRSGRPEQKSLSQQPLVQKPMMDPYLQYQPSNNNYKIEQQTNGNPADLAYFGGSKFDPKYQTLPYNTKFSPLTNYSGNQPIIQHHQHQQHQQQHHHQQQQHHHHHHQQQQQQQQQQQNPHQQWFGQHEDMSEENNRDLVNNNTNCYGVDQKPNGTAQSKKSVLAGQVLTNLGQNLQMQSSSRPINAQVYHTKPLSSSNHVSQRYSGMFIIYLYIRYLLSYYII